MTCLICLKSMCFKFYPLNRVQIYRNSELLIIIMSKYITMFKINPFLHIVEYNNCELYIIYWVI